MRYKFQAKHNFKPKAKRFAFSKLKEIGKKLIALSMLGAVGAIVYPWELHYEIINAYHEIPKKMAFTVSEINVEGLERLSYEEIAHLIDFNVGDNLFAIDLNEVKNKLETYPWVANAVVERELPASIRIIIEEERPKAVFIENNQRFFVNDSGKIIEKITDVPTGESYIYLMGEEANLTYSEILDQVYESEAIYQRIEGLVKVGQRRWDLKLKNNITLKLPQNNIIQCLSKFSKVIDDNIDFFKGGTTIDLRFMPEKIYIKY
jgi:cell division protein FtsQ